MTKAQDDALTRIRAAKMIAECLDAGGHVWSPPALRDGRQTCTYCGTRRKAVPELQKLLDYPPRGK